MSQNDLLTSHITVSSILLCPTNNCVHTYPKGLLFTFHNARDIPDRDSESESDDETPTPFEEE